jgi:putative endonuclease
MISRTEKGVLGELTAIDYLIKSGYVILDKNFRTRYGEIDIIGMDEEYIVFIEVKTRRNFNLGLPCESVTLDKQRRIARMALLYIAKNNLQNYNFRFDVVETVIDVDRVTYIRLIKDAFHTEMTI